MTRLPLLCLFLTLPLLCVRADDEKRPDLPAAEVARLKDLFKKQEQLENAFKFDEALKVAEEIHEARKRQQGEKHWETVDAFWQVRIVEKLAGMSKEDHKAAFRMQLLNFQCSQLQNLGRYAQARTLAEKGLAETRRLFGEEHPLTAISLINLGVTTAHDGNFAEGQKLLDQALAMRLRLLGEEHPQTGAAYMNLGTCLTKLGDYPRAGQAQQKGIAIMRRWQGEEHIDTLRAVNELGATLVYEGRLQRARELLEANLPKVGRRAGENSPHYMHTLTNLGAALMELNRFVEAEARIAQALELQQKLGMGRHPDRIFMLQNHALALHFQGRLAESEQQGSAAREILRQTLDLGHPDAGITLGSLGGMFRDLGRLAEAEAVHQKALSINRRLLGDGHPFTVALAVNLAETLRRQKKRTEARLVLETILERQRDSLAPDSPRWPEARVTLALLLLDEQEPAKALKVAEEALAAYQRLGLEASYMAARLQQVIAEAHLQEGRLAEAKRAAEAALQLAIRVGGGDNPGCVGFRLSLALICWRQGELQQAEAHSRQAVELVSKRLGEQHPLLLSSLMYLGVMQQTQGDYAAAEQTIRAALVPFARARLESAASGLDRSVAATSTSPLTVLAALEARSGRAVDAWNTLERHLGRGLLDELSQSRRLTGAERDRLRQLRSVVDRLDKVLTLPTPNDPEQQKQLPELSKERNTAQAALAEFEAELARKYQAAAGQSYELAAIQAALPADVAILTWLDLPGLSRNRQHDEHWVCVVRRSGAPSWVRLPGSGPNGAWTVEDDRLPEQVADALRRRDSSPGQLLERLRRQRLAPAEIHLAARDGLPAVKRLIVLPSLAVAGVPIETLAEGYTISYAPSGTLHAWLREQRPVVGEPSLLALGDPAFPPEPAASPLPEGGVYLADVIRDGPAAKAGVQARDVLLQYDDAKLSSPKDLDDALKKAAAGKGEVKLQLWRDGKSVAAAVPPGKLGVQISMLPAAEVVRKEREEKTLTRGLRRRSWPPLPGARHEVESIAKVYRDRSADARTLTLLGSDASEARLTDLAVRGELKKFRHLHLATHGEANAQAALQSALILAQDQLPDPWQQVLEGKPVLNGKITAAQVLRDWELDADLVVLSACESGLGRPGEGEGFLGFSQALLLAGARSVVLSQWQVSDAATTLLMVRFYENLLGKRAGLDKPMPKADALAESKHWLRNLSHKDVETRIAGLPEAARGLKLEPPAGTSPAARSPAARGEKPFAHPYYWSAFILIGDPN